jgi:hypothetical protein
VHCNSDFKCKYIPRIGATVYVNSISLDSITVFLLTEHAIYAWVFCHPRDAIFCYDIRYTLIVQSEQCMYIVQCVSCDLVLPLFTHTHV